MSESSDALSELSSELEESDEEQPTAKAAAATGAQAQTNGRYPRRARKKFVEINIDHQKFRKEGTWGASDTQRKKKKTD